MLVNLEVRVAVGAYRPIIRIIYAVRIYEIKMINLPFHQLLFAQRSRSERRTGQIAGLAASDFLAVEALTRFVWSYTIDLESITQSRNYSDCFVALFSAVFFFRKNLPVSD